MARGMLTLLEAGLAPEAFPKSMPDEEVAVPVPKSRRNMYLYSL